MTHRLLRSVLAASATVAVLLLSACGSDAPPTGEQQSGGAVDPTLLADARAGGASEEQVALLEDGTVTFQEYQDAVRLTLSCMRTAGIDVVGDSVTESRGFPEIQYSFSLSAAGRTEEQNEAIADECIGTHSFWVEAAYQLSPGSVEAMEAAFDTYRATIVECLRDNGADVEDDVSRMDALGKAWDVEADRGVDCLTDVGYQG